MTAQTGTTTALGADVEADHEPADSALLDRRARRTAGVLLALIVITVAVIVFMPGPPDAGGQDALKAYLFRAHRHGLPLWINFDLIQNLANVVMFAPVGLLGSLALRRRNYLIVLIAALFSGLIEGTQLFLLPDRVASWADIAANTVGALIGFGLSVPALRRRQQRRHRYAHGRRSAADSPRRAARASRL
jgi:glycopeptide antibiotics resistance protein